MATHFYQLAVNNIRQETASCISVSFIIPPALKTAFAFTQGQNIAIKIMIDGEELRRSYSICSSPLEDELRIAIKKISGGKFSNWASNHLKKGTTLDVLPPSGKFFTELNAAHKKNYIAFAAGSGITPILSIIKTTLATEPGSSFTLIYGNSNRSSIIFKEELEAIKNKYISRFSTHHILSRETTETSLYNGRIDAAKCEQIFSRLININSYHEFFLCGPEEMIFSLKTYLQQKGIEHKKIHFELFTVPGQKQPVVNNLESIAENLPPDKISKITIKSDGISADFDLLYNGEAILNEAIKLGIDLPFACKGGVCATCRAKLITGEVMMDNNYALEPEEIKKGSILTCQAHPRSETVVIDFDSK